MWSEAGSRWYPEARDAIARQARSHNLPVRMVAGIVAATSPRTRWSQNLRASEAVILGRRLPNLLPLSYARANRIRSGEDPYVVLKGPKTRAFYRALLGDDSAIVLDTWMLRYLKWKNDKPTPKQYRELAKKLSREARRAGVPTAAYQASVWLRVRREAEAR